MEKQVRGMEKIKISIIVPVYKVENCLERCIQSLLHQTYTNLEIILVEDGSPDHCPIICDKWAVLDHRIKVIHKKNGGLSSARNAGIEQAKGMYIGFVDSDDYIDSDMFRILADLAIKSDSDITACGYYEVWENRKSKVAEKITSELTGDEAITCLLTPDTRVLSYAWNKLYKKESIGKIRFAEDLLFGEDTPFLYEVLKQCKRYTVTSGAFYYYVRRPDSLIGYEYTPKLLMAVSAGKKIEEDCRINGEKHLNEARFFTALQTFCVLKEYLQINRTEYLQDGRYLREIMKEYSVSLIRSYAGTGMAIKWGLCKWGPRLFRYLKQIQSRCYLWIKRGH